MFGGGDFNDEYDKPFEQVSTTDLNGTTNFDRTTNYFENVPISALDMALWMESDRMGHLAGQSRDDARPATRRRPEREARG